MYKFLLCWRYLRTRYIALASIVSVTLGVATMIVVNSVMAGFSHEMQQRIHGILADVVFEAHTLEGFYDAQWHMEQIDHVAGKYIEGMTPTIHVPAMLSFEFRGQVVTRPVQLIGIDERTQGKVSSFGQYLQHPANRQQMDFSLREDGFDTCDHQSGPDSPQRPALAAAGWKHRRVMADQLLYAESREEATTANSVPDPESQAADKPTDPFAQANGKAAVSVFDPAQEQHTGLVLGIALASYRDQQGNDQFLLLPGDDVKLTLPTAGTPPRAIDDSFTIVDFYESKMSEYDASFVFVPLERLQQLRGMIDPRTGVGLVTAIQIKCKPGVDPEFVRNKLRAAFPAEVYSVSTWRDKQGPLLAAVQMETAILNVLLFLIIAVAGFGILAIFFMIVVEKTRDIGVLKSLGASGRGIMGIFLAYGLSLGTVGAGVGMLLGLLFVAYINEIADVLGMITGQPVFNPEIYYFYKIPTIVSPFTLAWIVLGALVIAVLASVMPARRAASLHPVEALRYE